MTTITTLIFDLDGTLADCKELHQQSFRQVVTQVCPSAEYTDEDVEGLPTREKMKMLKSRGYEFNETELNRIKQELTQKNITKYVKFNPELKDHIKRLSKTYKLCLASNATHKFVYTALGILEITKYFCIINTATTHPAKPNPLTFVDCINGTSSNSYNTVVFEDSMVGLTAAKKIVAEKNVITVVNAKDLVNKLKDY
jgi:HAD superfamily hydrolase (TIGR01509 family)